MINCLPAVSWRFHEHSILVDEFMPFAIKMLTEYREFLPYGGHMKNSGEIVHAGASNGEEHPKSIDLINILRDANIKLASKREIKASCVVYDTSIKSISEIEQDDAIVFELDHIDGYSTIVSFPYSFNSDEIPERGEAWMNHGSNTIFKTQST